LRKITATHYFTCREVAAAHNRLKWTSRSLQIGIAMYESDHTKFMRELMAQKPQLAEEQKKGRAIWWDKSLDPDQQAQFKQARVPQAAYVYGTKV
jgi:Protein of unknown function (DUF3460)